MPWCVFANLEWMELLNNNNCCSPPLRNWAETGSMLLFLQHNAFPSKMEGLNQMTNSIFTQKHDYLCLSRQQRRQKGLAIWVERTCFRHVSLTVLKENKSLEKHLKGPYWRMKLNAGLFELWNKVCSFSGDVSAPITALTALLSVFIQNKQKCK